MNERPDGLIQFYCVTAPLQQKSQSHYLHQLEATSQHNYTNSLLTPSVVSPEHQTSQHKDITHLKEKDKRKVINRTWKHTTK